MKNMIFITTLCLILVLSACGSQVSYQNDVQDLCGLDVSGSIVVSNEDTHGGFLGDGSLIVEFDCAAISDHIVRQVEEWDTLPLSENLQLIMYGGVRDNISYNGYDLAGRCGIPEVSNGCYFFKDRHDESTDCTDDSALFDRASYHFSLLIYDFDTARLYLLEFDT